MNTFRIYLYRLLLPLALCGLAGCQSAAYYAQAVQGQTSILVKRQPIPRLLAQPDTAPELRARLEAVQRIRAFAASQLGLPARRQYASYVELGRSYPVWSVTAAPELSLTPRTWCYWIVGCLSYRGFFDEATARRFARRLEAEGEEVYLGGVTAYSTLGWFRDPVLSSFARLPEPELAELIFHELTHQLLYVPGDTVFNESLAVAVAEEGLRRYSLQQGLDLGQLEQVRRRQREFVALVLEHRQRLETGLAAAPTDTEKRQAKAAFYAALRSDYAVLRQGWGGYAGYDAWFDGLNNARLNSVATYYQLVPALRALLQEEGGNMARFLARCRALARLDIADRHRHLKVLLARAGTDLPPS
ncbi:MAG: putative aminopeptidase [Moraxellaceae bacterium]|jgi:predicted aminopeptidase|nr:putative aminopeptidase [Moraxellaceae bacterium]